MLIAVDIGNTNIVVGCFEAESLLFEFRLKTDLKSTVDEYSAFFRSILAGKLADDVRCDRAIVSSVVPPLTSVFVGLLQSDFDVDPLLVGPGIKTGLSIKTTDPAALGSDRVVNAVGLKEFYGLPGLVIDFGTATSVDYVDGEGNYMGGVIVPGIEISLDALVMNTAKLPKIELAWPESVIGKNTVGAMQSGSVIGYHCLIEGLIETASREVGELSHVIATGGLGKLMSAHSKQISSYDPYLTLKGMRYLADLNS